MSKLSISIVIFLIGFISTLCAQNVGINATGATPHSSAGLDINFTDKGVLIPRVALTALNSASPISSPTVSLLVYNTATAGSSPNNVVPGYYYWDGSVWVAISAWSLLGNAGTTAGNNFIGTTDPVDLVFKTKDTEAMRIAVGGNVGIGTGSSPSEQLEITKNFRLPATTSSTVGVIKSGANRFIHNYGTNNTFLGVNAGNFTTSGTGGNVGIGVNALSSNTTGESNVAIGGAAGGNTTGHYNVAIGNSALALNSSGTYNCAYGAYALYRNTVAGNVAIGGFALAESTSGPANVAIGYTALYQNTTGGYNTALGSDALRTCTTGSFNTASGQNALGFTTGSYNTAIGRYAGLGNITGSNNTYVGYGADGSTNNLTNSSAFGYGAVTNANDKIRLGDAAVTVVEGPVAYTVSDGRFKYDISETDVKGLEFIKRLRPVVYNFNTQQLQEFLMKNISDSIKQTYFKEKDFSKSSGIRQSGFIAQEVEQAMKESGYNFNGVHVPENENDNYSLAYGQFVVPIIKAMQEQQQTIEEQQVIIKQQQVAISNMEAANKKLQSEVSNVQSENKTIKVNYDNRLKALEEIMGVRAQK